MGYAAYLKDMLRPLQVYNMHDGYGLAELEAIGMQLDGVCSETDILKKECVVPSAEGYGLQLREEILPYIPAYNDIKSRRAAIISLEQIDETCFTKEALNRTISGCGITAEVSETDKWYTVCVNFPDVRGIPLSIDKLTKRVEAILPCHLNVEYKFNFTIWNELEAAFSTWNQIESAGLTFDGMETYVPAES